MKRKILWAFVILLAVDLASVFGQYGIRLKESPCTHLMGLGVVVNYLTKDCPKFRWQLAVSPVVHRERS